jgi:hypothetical protein
MPDKGKGRSEGNEKRKRDGAKGMGDREREKMGT